MVTRNLHILERLETGLGLPIEWAGRLAAWCGLAMVLVVAGNVFARYIFNAGSVAIQELEWHLVSPIALIGMSYAMRQGEHVRVDFLYDRMSESGKQIIQYVFEFRQFFFREIGNCAFADGGHKGFGADSMGCEHDGWNGLLNSLV